MYWFINDRSGNYTLKIKVNNTILDSYKTLIYTFAFLNLMLNSCNHIHVHTHIDTTPSLRKSWFPAHTPLLGLWVPLLARTCHQRWGCLRFMNTHVNSYRLLIHTLEKKFLLRSPVHTWRADQPITPHRDSPPPGCRILRHLMGGCFAWPWQRLWCQQGDFQQCQHRFAPVFTARFLHTVIKFHASFILLLNLISSLLPKSVCNSMVTV